MTTLERLAGRAQPAFCIYRNQPVILLAQRWSGRPSVTFVLVLGLLVVARVLVTITEGTLGPVGNVVADLKTILLGSPAATPSAKIEWLRDYADIGIMLLISAHTAHMVGQWHRLSMLPETLRAAGLLPRALAARATFTAILGAYERRFNSLRLEVAAAVIAGIVVAPVAALPSAVGLYPGLGDHPTPLERYAGWWANPALHPAAFAILVISLWLYLYLTVRHGLMGITMVRLIRSAQRVAAEDGEAWVGYGNVMGSTPAIAELRSALFDVIVSITLLVSAFVVGTYWVSFPQWLVLLFIVPYLILNPVFLIWPTLELNRGLRTTWARSYEAATRELRVAVQRADRLSRRKITAETQDAPERQLALRIVAAEAKVASLETSPKSVIDLLDIGKASLIYLVPVIGLIPMILSGRS